MRIWNYQMLFLEQPLANSIDLGITPINFICCLVMFTVLHCSHFEALLSFTTIRYITWPLVHNKAPVQVNNFQSMGHSGKEMTSTKALMAGLKWSPLGSCLDKGNHVQVHGLFHKHRQETIQSFGQHLPAVHLTQNLLPVHLDLQPVHLGGLHNPTNKMIPATTETQDRWCCGDCGLALLYWGFPMMNVRQITRAMIHWTWEVPKEKPK